MNKRDYYEILGLSKNASDDDIKKAYRRLASKYHPDKVQGDTEKAESEIKFKEAKEAYECLSDPDKKAQYDQFGHSGSFTHVHQSPRGHTRTWTFDPAGGNDFQDIFGDILRGNPAFDGMFRQQKQQQPINLINISLENAYKGTSVKLDIHTINIPSGVRSGTKFFVDSKLFRIDILPHNKFKRSNDDLLVDIEISAIEAMIGAEAILEHLDGVKLQFNIPQGIQGGQIIKLNGKGMKNPELDRYGDMLVRVNIKVPKTLSDQQKEMLRSFEHREIINI